jgi:hypothetical protein
MTAGARVGVVLLALLLLAAVPGAALAVCFDVTGLPEGASLDLAPLAASPLGQAPLVGEAQGVCGLGQPPAVVQGTVILDPNGAARVGVNILAARIGCSNAVAELVLPPPFTSGTGSVRLPEGSVANVSLALDLTGTACRPRNPRATACVGDATTLCLLQDRFRATATARVLGLNQPGQAARQGSELGFFAFPSADPAAVELLVKVLDGRGINDRYWVVATPTTSSVEYTLTVTDTQTGQIRSYASPVGAALGPVRDTSAFPGP